MAKWNLTRITHRVLFAKPTTERISYLYSTMRCVSACSSKSKKFEKSRWSQIHVYTHSSRYEITKRTYIICITCDIEQAHICASSQQERGSRTSDRAIGSIKKSNLHKHPYIWYIYIKEIGNSDKIWWIRSAVVASAGKKKKRKIRGSPRRTRVEYKQTYNLSLWDSIGDDRESQRGIVLFLVGSSSPGQDRKGRDRSRERAFGSW